MKALPDTKTLIELLQRAKESEENKSVSSKTFRR